MPEDIYATAGHLVEIARKLAMAGVGPEDIDVAELYDHFSGMVWWVMELPQPPAPPWATPIT
jgi:hypothetical protein